MIERLSTNARHYCVAIDTVFGTHGIELEGALAVRLKTCPPKLFQAAILQVAIRLSVIGQLVVTVIIVSFEAVALDVAAACADVAARAAVRTAVRAAVSIFKDLRESAAIIFDIMAMRHEARYSRLFRSLSYVLNPSIRTVSTHLNHHLLGVLVV